MKTLVSGSTGLIGKTLTAHLSSCGHEVVKLVRTQAQPPGNQVYWDPSGGVLEAAALEGFEVVVHLAGENIAGGRWTAEAKRRIRESRVQGTTLLAQSLARLAHPAKVMVSASAIGYYGDRGEEILREDSKPGCGFLPTVCREWEKATEAAREMGIRVVCLRIGLVLSAEGGALARMLPPFRFGVGGKIGSGRQYMSWLTLDDLVGIIRFCIENESIGGPVNAVAPQAVTNLEFTSILGRVLCRPTLFPLPAFAARIALGEMADGLLLASTRAEPARLLASGFQYQHPDLEGALRRVLRT